MKKVSSSYCGVQCFSLYSARLWRSYSLCLTARNNIWPVW